MDKNQPPQYGIPIDLLDNFQIQWNAYKSLQEYIEFVKARPELAALGQNEDIDQALYLTGEILGQDLSQSLVAILNAVGETLRQRGSSES